MRVKQWALGLLGACVILGISPGVATAHVTAGRAARAVSVRKVPLVPALTPGEGTGKGWCTEYGTSGVTGLFSYDNVWACGPDDTTGPTPFDSNGTASFQCVELSERFLWAVYGLAPIFGSDVDGDTLVSLYHSAHPSIAVGSPGPSSLPQPGDVMSFNEGGDIDSSAGHTAVVVSAPNSSGNFTIMSENWNNTAGEETAHIDMTGGHDGHVQLQGSSFWNAAPYLELKMPAPSSSTNVCQISGVNGGTTGSGKTEVHCLYGPSFQSRLDVATPWGYLNTKTDPLFMTDLTGNGDSDLCQISGVNGGTTGSGKTEVHCLYGPSFQSRLDVATPWGYLNTKTDPLFMTDLTGNGDSDLCQISGVNGGTTGSGKTEVHCLYGPSFQSRLDVATPWGYLNTKTDPLFMTDLTGNGDSDLCQISGVNGGTTGSGKTEVHCLYGPSFQSRLDVATPWGYLNTKTDPLFMTDLTGNGDSDLCQISGVNGGTTGSGKTEVHCLYGPSFQSRLDVATPWGYLNTKTDPLFMTDLTGNGDSDLCQISGVNGGTTGSGKTEVHCLYGPSFQSRLDVATPWGYLDTKTDPLFMTDLSDG